jgi:steroid delta-isomerase-like uncharacterized protein
MAAEENKAIARRYIEEVWGKGDVAAERELLAPNFVDRHPVPGFPDNREGHHQTLVMFRNAFPDLRMSLEFLVAEGDKVVDHWTARATHQGDLMGMPATGKQITITGSDVLRIENGKIAEIWHEEDMLGMMQQLGAVPAM